MNETLSIASVDAASFSNGGSATVSGDGLRILYTPAANFSGTETFRYTLRDSRGGTAQGTVTMTVTPQNDPPSAANDTFTFTKDTGPHELNVLANDAIAPDAGETLTITNASVPPAAGTVQVVSNGQRIQFTPAAGFTGDAVISYTIDDGNGGTDTATATVTIRDFVPSRLAGFVYFDRDDDGAFDAAEAPIGGVTIMLTGTDSFGEAVSRTAVTQADGSYTFADLAPGSYTLAQTQPVLVIDGKETVGSQGGQTANDRFTITLAEGVNGTSNNFAERGPSAQFVRLMDFFAIRTAPLVLTASTAGQQSWYSARDDWDAFDNVLVDLADDLSSVAVSVVADGDTQDAISAPTGGNRAQIIRQNGQTTLVGITATSATFGFEAPPPPSGAMAMAAAMAAGEFGEDAADLAATDSVFEEMGQ
jgi:hypothetical protein